MKEGYADSADLNGLSSSWRTDMRCANQHLAVFVVNNKKKMMRSGGGHLRLGLGNNPFESAESVYPFLVDA